MIRAEDLTKRYGPTLALDRLSLAIPAGSVFGLLGPNGAGKTTLLRLIMGLVFPEGGRLDYGGLRPSRIGYLPERAFYPARCRVREYLTAVARVAGLNRRAAGREVAGLLERLELGEVSQRCLGACSRGMLQRVGLAQALLADPPLLLLDEPVHGLDPAGQKFMRDQVADLAEAGRTVVLSSHNLGEVARVCTDVAMLKHGRLVRSGSLATLLSPRPEITILTGPMPARLPSDLRALAPGILATEGRVKLVGDGALHKAEILRLLLEAEVDIQELTEQKASLEEIYLEATGP